MYTRNRDDLGAVDPAEVADFLASNGFPPIATERLLSEGVLLAITVDPDGETDGSDPTYGADAMDALLDPRHGSNIGGTSTWQTEGYDPETGPFWSPTTTSAVPLHVPELETDPTSFPASGYDVYTVTGSGVVSGIDSEGNIHDFAWAGR